MISSTATYALRAVVYLASQPDRYVCRSEISEATFVPHEYLLKVLNLLDVAQIVESRRGPGGGYRLSLAPNELCTLQVVRAVDPIPRTKACSLGVLGHKQLCPLQNFLDEMAGRVEEAFAGIRISDLLGNKNSQNLDLAKINSVLTGVFK
ncbi:MAG: Rrf2 family transcriptional regulator [Planctomycetaceae bacterium]|nr:Rrf2 family transcriptional regulator [Planctomycetaceae bacterium]